MPKAALKSSPAQYTGAELGASIRRTLRFLVAATLVLYLLVLGIGLYSYTVSKNNRDSLCIFKYDLEQRIAQTEDYLKKNKSNEPIPGVSRATLETNLAGQQRTVKAFKNLNCPPFPKG